MEMVERRGSSAASRRVLPIAATSAARGATCCARASLRSERMEDLVKVVVRGLGGQSSSRERPRREHIEKGVLLKVGAVGGEDGVEWAPLKKSIDEATLVEELLAQFSK
eukprot:jgi/Mesvir1/5166/Mv15304-RA.1